MNDSIIIYLLIGAMIVSIIWGALINRPKRVLDQEFAEEIIRNRGGYIVGTEIYIEEIPRARSKMDKAVQYLTEELHYTIA